MLSSIQPPQLTNALHRQPLLLQSKTQNLTYDSQAPRYLPVSPWVWGQTSLDRKHLTQFQSAITQQDHRGSPDLISPSPRPSVTLRGRQGRWLFGNDQTTTSLRPPLNPLEFVLKQRGQNSLKRRHGFTRKKNKLPSLSFWVPQESSANDCTPTGGLSAITLLNFLVAAANTVTNILDNNNNNNDNNNNNNNNVVNVNANNNNNNANNVNNIDLGRRFRRQVVQDSDAQTSKIQTEVLLAMILALDLATAVRRIEINTTELAPNGHQSIQIEDHEIHKEFTSNIQVNYTDPMHNQQVNNKRSISLQGRNKHSTSILEAQSTRHQFQPQYLPGDNINYFVKNSPSPSEYQVSTPSEDHELPWVHGWPTANVMVPNTPKKTQNNSLPTSGLAATICTTYRNADEAGELTGMVLRELMRPLLPIMWSRPLLMC